MAWEQWGGAPSRLKVVLLLCGAGIIGLAVLAARAVDLNEPYLPFAISGTAVFYLRIRSSLREKCVWVLCSAGFAAFVHFAAANWIVATSSSLALFGFGAFLMLAQRALWSAEDARRKALAALAPAAAVVFFVFSAQHALSLANLLYPKTYDLYLYAFDGSLGFQPSFLAGQILAKWRVLALAAVFTYISLPLFMAVVYALRLPRDAESPSWDIISLLMLAGIIGCLLYNIVPATGPVFVFRGDFPSQPLPFHLLPRLFLEQIPVAGDVPRNAMPSLHMAWVLLLFWNSRTLPKSFRVIAAIYTALTALATLGTGEHYMVDLVVSMPFALLVQTIVSPGAAVAGRLRLMVIAVSLAMTSGWLAVVRCATKLMLLSPAVPWILIVASCGIVLMLKHQLSANSVPVLKTGISSAPVPASMAASAPPDSE